MKISGIVPIFLAALLIPVSSSFAEKARTKPNILLIVGDDLGYADVGFHGSKENPHAAARRARGVGCAFHERLLECRRSLASSGASRTKTPAACSASHHDGEVFDMLSAGGMLGQFVRGGACGEDTQVCSRVRRCSVVRDVGL